MKIVDKIIRKSSNQACKALFWWPTASMPIEL